MPFMIFFREFAFFSFRILEKFVRVIDFEDKQYGNPGLPKTVSTGENVEKNELFQGALKLFHQESCAGAKYSYQTVKTKLQIIAWIWK